MDLLLTFFLLDLKVLIKIPYETFQGKVNYHLFNTFDNYSILDALKGTVAQTIAYNNTPKLQMSVANP